MSKNIVVVYHSGYGHTRRVAEAVARGAQAALLPIDEHGNLPAAGWDAIAEARAVIFGSPTYLANVSWQFKRFIDASSAVWAKQGWKNKLAAGFTNSAGINGDKLMTLQTLVAMAQQHGMLWAGTGMMPSNVKASGREDLNYLASFTGLMTATPADAGVDEMHPGDLRTAEAFGARIANIVHTQLSAQEDTCLTC
ncbi:MAG: flavodoxin family protein [Thiobacillus sp.]|nr:flavodoxin family protein [Thiobacillus sp.]